MDFLSSDFCKNFAYEGALGASWQPQRTIFRLWNPLAKAVRLRLYSSWTTETPGLGFSMSLTDKGIWKLEVQGDLTGLYYTYEVQSDLKAPFKELVDPYAKAVGPQGLRGYIFNPQDSEPEDWEWDEKPELQQVNDAVIYELHIRDFSSDSTSGIRNKGLFAGLAEGNTKSPQNLATGLDHLSELGITHVHLLPIFDFDGTDDVNHSPEDYNWGYNPRNFNAVKNAYSTQPTQPIQAIKDLKTVVQACHKRGIGVVMDVVYNHTFTGPESNLNKAFPDYYYRQYAGQFSNGSGCGNELATERPMVRKYIIDSLLYWKNEYHLDGFRFDLMGLYDLETMKKAERLLRKDDATFLIYGEGWTGGLSTLPETQRTSKYNAKKIRGLAFFSDDTRDSLRGHVFEALQPGFINGGKGFEDTLAYAVSGCTGHSQVKPYSRSWAQGPQQTIQYLTSHDNLTLWDKLLQTNPLASDAKRIKMAKIAYTAIFLSQGIPFFMAGEEFLRSKQGNDNSYNAPDAINSIKWDLKEKNKDFYHYFQNLIALRKAHPAFRLSSVEQTSKYLRFWVPREPGLLVWSLGDWAGGDPNEKLIVALNAHEETQQFNLPEGRWYILAQKGQVLSHGLDKEGLLFMDGPGYAQLEGLSALVLTL